ncbi:MAG: outer membrane beta-barrel protein [Bacteroidales bacterium]|nr:outer membrane beta-barrel protein [Bacteroidales bacterium]
MKKSLFLFLLLCIPFWATAQWSVRAYAGGGFAYETANEVLQNNYSKVEQNQLQYGDYGYTFQGGINAQYFISRKFGFGTGLGYQYSKTSGFISTPPPEGTNWHSESFKIPFNLLWSPGKMHHSFFNIGLSTHFNLMKRYVVNYKTNYQYPVFSSVQLGYTHKLGEQFQLGIQFEKDLGWYSRTAYYETNTTSIDPRYFTSLQIIFSYRLFGKDGKKK